MHGPHRVTEGVGADPEDLSATDMLPFRRLLAAGFGDTAEQTGAGLAGTYPAEGSSPM